MKDRLLLGVQRHLLPVPSRMWRKHVAKSSTGNTDRLGFMSEDHHRVREFVVKELPRAGRPLTPDCIAQALGLPPDRVIVLLDDLEKHLTFLFRNPAGAVAWAYPVTVDVTPQRVTFSTGEQGYAA
jgi:hypothetical protein